jgi:hypothetical protein
MGAQYEIVLLIDARPPKAPLSNEARPYETYDEAYDDALTAASREVIELVGRTMHEGFGWLAPKMAGFSYVSGDVWQVDFYKGRLEWLFYAVGDFWQTEWLGALSARWPHWKLAVLYDTTNRMWAGSCLWDGKAWQIEDYDITDEGPRPQWGQIKALQKRDEWGRLDWGPPPVKGPK